MESDLTQASAHRHNNKVKPNSTSQRNSPMTHPDAGFAAKM